MYRIAIVDDDREFVEELKNISISMVRKKVWNLKFLPFMMVQKF